MFYLSIKKYLLITKHNISFNLLSWLFSYVKEHQEKEEQTTRANQGKTVKPDKTGNQTVFKEIDSSTQALKEKKNKTG